MTKLAFQKELESLLNRYSAENESNTPDWILAEYLMDCFDSFTKTSKAREKWYQVYCTPGKILVNRNPEFVQFSNEEKE